MPQFTPTQQRMLAVLADGLSHRKEELHACLSDDLGPVSNIGAHLTAIRKKLRPVGEDILCVCEGYVYRYRHVRLLASAYSGQS